jgi:hypothetical protein
MVRRSETMEPRKYIADFEDDIAQGLREGVHDALMKIDTLPDGSGVEQKLKTSAYVELLTSILSLNEVLDRLRKTVWKSLETRKVLQG